MSDTFYTELARLEQNGDAAVLCTVIAERGSVPRHAGSKMLVYPDGRFLGTVGCGEMESRIIRASQELLRGGAPQVMRFQLVDPAAGDPGVCGGEVEIFVEPIRPSPALLVIGGGHVGRALVHLARWLGFRVALSDDRPEFCNPEWAPGADEYWPVPVRELLQAFKFNTATYIVMPTRGMPLDVEALPALLDAPHAYVGVIGSRRRWATAVKRLQALGVPESKLAGIHAPMGLELNAETPEEIAVSIMAEITMLRRQGTGQPMRWDGLKEVSAA